MTIVDTTVYKSFVFIVEDGDNEYDVRCDENDVDDNWEIRDAKTGEYISEESKIGKDLIELCIDQKLMN